MTINNKIKRVKNHEREKYIEKIEKANFSFVFVASHKILDLEGKNHTIRYIIILQPSHMFTSVKHTHGFTLIELMVVITIIGILFVGSYIPYDYYSRLSRIRISGEKVRQTMEDAKILSQNGQIFPGTTKNANVGLLFEKNSHSITMFAFKPGTRSFTGNTDAKIIKTISLEDGVNITTLPEDQMLVEYSAPKGTVEIYKPTTDTGATFEVGIGWKTTTAGALYRTIKIAK